MIKFLLLVNYSLRYWAQLIPFTFTRDTEPQVTSPGTAVELNAHAHSARMVAVRHNAQPSRDERRVDLVQLRDVSVAVAREYLKEEQEEDYRIGIYCNK